MVTVKAALFDLDGTLVDTEGQYTLFWEKMGNKYCPQIPNFAQKIKGSTLTKMFTMYFPDPEVQKILKQLLDEWERSMVYSFYPGAVEFVRELRSNSIMTALVTSSDRVKMENVYHKVEGFKALFDCILTSEDFATSKPAPDGYLRAAEMLGCQREECVVFEDALTGLEAGMRAEIFTVGMATTNSRKVITGRCDYVLDSFETLTYQRLLNIRNGNES